MTREKLEEIKKYAEARLRVGDVATAQIFLLASALEEAWQERNEARAEVERLKDERDN